MFVKMLSSIILSSFVIVAVNAQTPETRKEGVRTFALAFESDGGYLGVQATEVNKENYAKYGLSEVRGVAIDKVVENSPAAAAGVRDGDVIIKFDGQDVTSTRKLTRLISEIAPDHQVRMTIFRSGSEQDMTATLGKRPMPKLAEGGFSRVAPMGTFELPNLGDIPELRSLPMPRDRSGVWTTPDGNSQVFKMRSGSSRQIGVGITALTKQLANHFGIENGVLINEVREDSPAFRAGLKAGDIIVEVNGKPVISDIDLARQINDKTEGDVQLTIVRNGKRQGISVTPEKIKQDGFVFEMEPNENSVSPIAPPARPAFPVSGFRFGRII